MKAVAVFCGSGRGSNPLYADRAFALGRMLAAKKITVVYGGAAIGLMGAVADGALSAGGKVTGVLPTFLGSREIRHEGLTELILVSTMHERKLKMSERCDGVIALPGGFGTLEELFEMLTWAQLGLHRKPVAILNIEGYFDPLIAFIDRMVHEGFLKDVNRSMLLVDDDPERLLVSMEAYTPAIVPKWIGPGET